MAASASASASGLVFDLDSYRPPPKYRIRRRFQPMEDTAVTVAKVYLVPYRWWMMIRSDDDVSEDRDIALYFTSPEHDDSGQEILMSLEKREPPPSADADDKAVKGRQFAFVPGFTWLRALVRRSYLKSTAAINDESLFGDTEFLNDVCPLKVVLVVSSDTNTMVVKIRKKINDVNNFNRACILFSSYSGPLHIWDFSGKTTRFFMNGKISLPEPGQLNKEVLLELCLHGFSGDKVWRDEIAENHFRIDGGSCKSDVMYRGVGSLGLSGLKNLGNTCYMNSGIQCLVHTPKLVDYFLGDYQRNMNHGELTFAFGELLKKLWVPGARTVIPIMFKQKLATYATQFSGNNQHDSQELLTLLVDRLHEDLNEPYCEAKDAETCPDEEMDDQALRKHLACNNSIICNTFLGQSRSKLVCSDCNKVSIIFETFMQLQVPLPTKAMALTVLSTDGAALPTIFTVTVPLSGKLLDLTDALSVACSLKDDETLLVAEICQGRAHHFFEDPSDMLSGVAEVEKLVAYRLPKGLKRYQLVLYVHQEREKFFDVLDPIGIPFLAVLPNPCHGYDIHETFVKYLVPFLKLDEDISEVLNEDSETDWETEENFNGDSDFQFYSLDAKGEFYTEIEMNQLVDFSNLPVKPRSDILEVLVPWSEKMVMKYDTRAVTFLPKVFNSSTHGSVSLYKCLEDYQEEEIIDLSDMWNCPSCMIPRKATKKLDLWRLPEILVIHLERFRLDYTGKLDTLIDFPLYDLDISGGRDHLSNRYMLYATSNHYGQSMNSGHYTAFVQVGGKGSWYEFNDDIVSPIHEDMVKTSAAYVLFYRRVPDPDVQTLQLYV